MADVSTDVLTSYAPLQKLKDKAVQLKAELASLQLPAATSPPRKSPVREHGRSKGRASYAGGSELGRVSQAASHLHSPQLWVQSTSGSLPRAGSAAHDTHQHQHPSTGFQRTASLARSVLHGEPGGKLSTESQPLDLYPAARLTVCLPSTRSLTSCSSRPASPAKGAQDAMERLQSRVWALESEMHGMQVQLQQQQLDGDRRQASYMRREGELQAQVKALEEQLLHARGGRPAEQGRFGKTTDHIMHLHGEVTGKIEELLEKQAVVVRYEEQSHMRKLKGKLAEVEAELEAERGGSGRVNADWLERTKSLRAEFDSLQAVCSKLDAMYKLSAEECSRLRAQFKCQEDDREYLVRQVVSLRKENRRLAVELAAMAAEAAATAQERDEALDDMQGVSSRRSNTGESVVSGADREAVQVKVQRYEDVLDSMRKLLEAERRRTRQARAAHAAELATRTELFGLLRQCVDDVRRQRVGLGEAAAGARDRQGPHAPRPHSALSFTTTSPAAVAASIAASLRARPLSASTAARAGLGGAGLQPQQHAVGGASRGAVTGRLRSDGGSRPQSASARRILDPSGAPSAAAADAHMDTVKEPAVSSASQLSLQQRQQLVADLTRQEAVLTALAAALSPAGAGPPSLPGDTTRLDRLVQSREEADATVVANARALAHMQQRRPPSPTSAKALLPPSVAAGATPGGPLAKTAAGRPWVFGVDHMLQEFLQGSGRGA